MHVAWKQNIDPCPDDSTEAYDALANEMWSNIKPRLIAFRWKKKILTQCKRVSVVMLAVGLFIYSFFWPESGSDASSKQASVKQPVTEVMKQEKKTTTIIKSKKYTPVHKQLRQPGTKILPTKLITMDPGLVKTGIINHRVAQKPVQSLKQMVPAPDIQENKNLIAKKNHETMPGTSPAVFIQPGPRKFSSIKFFVNGKWTTDPPQRFVPPGILNDSLKINIHGKLPILYHFPGKSLFIPGTNNKN